MRVVRHKEELKRIEETQQNDQDYKQMFENLEEGIILYTKGKIYYANKIFNKIIKGLDIIKRKSSTVSDDVMNLKIFKLYRCGKMFEDEEDSSQSHQSDKSKSAKEKNCLQQNANQIDDSIED